MASIFLTFTVAVLAVAMLALYRQVGMLGRQMDSESAWPFANTAVGQLLFSESVPEFVTFTGLAVLCADDTDALSSVFSVSVVAKDWNQPFAVVVGATGEPTGWAAKLNEFVGGMTLLFVEIELLRALSSVRLPVAVYLQEGRVLDGTVALGSPSVVAERFRYVASPLRDADVRSIEWR